MNKLTYLKLAVQQHLYIRKAWFVSAFSITREPKEAYLKDPYVGRIVSEDWGYSFVNAQGELEKIDDAKAKEPLFTFKERLTVDQSYAANISSPIESSIGSLLFNHICILSSFGPKYPYIAGKYSVNQIEDYIAPKLTDTPKPDQPRSSELIYVDEYVKFVDSLQFISNLSTLMCWSATPKTITAPPGVREFKAGLIEKYGDTLTDPVSLSKFEGELLAYDAAYLKGDPSDGTFVTGKIRNIARKKMYLTLGAEQLTFKETTKAPTILNSLEEGWPTDPEQYTMLMNSLRIGSYARGAETVKGGVSAKTLLRATNDYVIVDTDCGSTLGIHRNFKASDIRNLVGRYRIVQNKPVLIASLEEAAPFAGVNLILRSPMYCKLDGSNRCRYCAGENLAKFPEGVSIPSTEISSIILAASMAAMHGKPLTIAKIQLSEAFT